MCLTAESHRPYIAPTDVASSLEPCRCYSSRLLDAMPDSSPKLNLKLSSLFCTTLQAGALSASSALSENVEAEGFLLNRFYIHIMFEVRFQASGSHGTCSISSLVAQFATVLGISSAAAGQCCNMYVMPRCHAAQSASDPGPALQVLSPMQQACAEVAASPYPTDVVEIGSLLQQDARDTNLKS